MIQTKRWYESKIIWLNIFSLTIGILGVLNADFLEFLGFKNATTLVTVLGTFNTVGNLILRRYFTNIAID